MKLIIKLSITIVALFMLTMALLLILVDPNDYKDEIQTQVKQTINRDLHIKGDLGWTFYPQLGFSSGEIELDNLSGFSKPHLVKIDGASLGINILPLLKGEISIGVLTLDGFSLTLLTDKNGVSNLDNMGSTAPATEQPVNEPSQSAENGESFFDVNKTQLAGININNAVIELEDLQAGSYQKITINEIKLGQFALDKETEFAINTKIIIDDLQANIELKALLLVNNNLSSVKLNKLQVNTAVTANAQPNGSLKSQLNTELSYAVVSKNITLNDINLSTVVIADNLPNKKVSTQLNADITYQINQQLATITDLALQVDQLTLNGGLSVQTADLLKVRYDLVANEWDLNHYIEKKDESTQQETTPTDPQPEIEPDLSFLHDLDIDGQLKIAGVKIDNIKIGEINNRLIIKQGKAKIKPLTAQLYQGLLTFNGEVNESKGLNKYQVSTQLANVQIHQLLIDAAELDILSGDTSFNFTGQGQGLTTTKIKQGLVGKGDFKLLDGELYGVNIPQEIRSLKAKLTGKKSPTTDSIKKTDFASLTGDFTIKKGLVNNQELLMLSPVMRLDGSGLVHIIKESLDYKLSISPLSKSKADTDYADLSGLTIPLLIKGSFTDPKFSVDTDSALKEQLKANLEVEKKKLKEKANKILSEQTKELDLDIDSQEKIKKESKKLEDKFKKLF